MSAVKYDVIGGNDWACWEAVCPCGWRCRSLSRIWLGVQGWKHRQHFAATQGGDEG